MTQNTDHQDLIQKYGRWVGLHPSSISTYPPSNIVKVFGSSIPIGATEKCHSRQVCFFLKMHR